MKKISHFTTFGMCLVAIAVSNLIELAWPSHSYELWQTHAIALVIGFVLIFIGEVRTHD